MAEGIVFLASPLALALFGLPAAWARPVDRFSAAARFSAAFVAGVVAFTIWLTLLSAVGIAWSVVSVLAPLASVSLAGALILRRRRSNEPGIEGECGPVAWIIAALSLAVGTAHLVLAALTSRATSIDYLYFWGVKALRFAEIRGIDATLLASPFAAHMHSNYPPLVPLVYAWGIEVAGRLPWQFGLASYAMWLLIALPLLRELLLTKLGHDDATLAVSFWFMAFALALPAALSAGNAESPIVLFTSVAVAALLSGRARWLAIVAMAGLALTKNEGLVVVGLIAMGAIAHDVVGGVRGSLLARRAALVTLLPLLAFGSWLLFGALHDVPMLDATREDPGTISFERAGEVTLEFARHFDAGSGGIAWLVAAALLAYSWRRWRDLLPALIPTLGVLAFLFVYYLHFREDDLAGWIRWTMPRVSLSALGAAILGAAFAASPARHRET